MKKKIVLLVVVMAALVPPTLGDGLPFAETIEIERFGNQYSKLLTFPVYVKEGSTIETENRTIKIDIGPEVFMEQEDGTSAFDNKELFIKVLVSIVLIDTDFKSYLNCRCDEHGGQLLWDHAGEDEVDKAGEPFLRDSPLIVEDEYFKVTLRLVDLEISPEKCGIHDPRYLNCNSDYECLFYMNSLTLELTVAYSLAQENLKSQYETGLGPETSPPPEESPTPEEYPELEKAVEHEEKAANFFSNREYQNAILEYQQARAIYDRLDNNKKVREIQTQIDLCNSYIVAENDLEKGIELFHEAEKIEGEGNIEDAREKYEEAREKFETAKNEFEKVGDQIQTTNCQNWFDECNNRIGSIDARIKAKAKMKAYLTIGAIAVLVVGAGGVAVRHRKKKDQDVTIQKERVPEPQILEDTQPKPQVLTCPLCKNEIQEDWALCPYCGVRLKEDTQIY